MMMQPYKGYFTDERRSVMVACRMYGLLFVLFSGLALGPPWPSVAQQATPPYGAPISLEQAKKIIAIVQSIIPPFGIPIGPPLR